MARKISRGARSLPRKTVIDLTSSSSSAASTKTVIDLTSSSSSAASTKTVIDLTSSSSSTAAGSKVVTDLISSSSSPAISTEDEATSQPGKRGPYHGWGVQDKINILTTFADLRRQNLGVIPEAPVILKALNDGDALVRRGVNAAQISRMMRDLHERFIRKTTAKVIGARGRRFRRRRRGLDDILYEKCKEAWPELLTKAKC